MKVVTRHIKLEGRADTPKITPLGDVHYGGRDCDMKLLKQCVAKIAGDKSHYWIGMGDLGEFINMKDKRFDADEIEPSLLPRIGKLAQAQSEDIIEILSPIKDRCLGLLCGNHEETIRLRYEHDIHSHTCAGLYDHESKMGIVSPSDLDLGYSAFIRLKFGRTESLDSRAGKKVQRWKQFVIYAHHGAGGGRKKGSKVNRLEDITGTFADCDLYVMGHVHDKMTWVTPSLHIAERDDVIRERWRAFGITGTFKRTYQQDGRGYGEKMMYPATALGVISFIVTPFPSDEKGTRIDTHNSTSGLPA